MRLTVLSVAYPLAPAGPDAVGGAEQVLAHLDTALMRAGHRSIVVACEGSVTAGTLVATPAPNQVLSEAVRQWVQEQHGIGIERALDRWPIDIVHMHGFDFHAYLPPAGVPVLATLHCPVDWYAADALKPTRPCTYLNAVSARQHELLPASAALLPPIENGVRVDKLAGHYAKRGFALMLSRIAPEKGVHLAIDAAKATDLPLLIAGGVFPYPEHERYFAQEVLPRLDRRRRTIGPVGFRRKRRLLAAARCLVVPSRVAETSSLVAREAIAAGTPVVAFRQGALVDTVEDGRTGFLVDDVAALGQGMLEARHLDPEVCREAARRRFSAEQMIRSYLRLYSALARMGASEPIGASPA